LSAFFPNSYALAREDTTDDMRRDAILVCLAKAEADCHLASDEDTPLKQRVEAIVRAAPAFGLEPRLYQLAWMIRKWAARPSM
jgi:coenzyme F420-reducing hydrogenase delta subunit